MKAKVRRTSGGDWKAVVMDGYYGFYYETLGFDTKKTAVQAARYAAAKLRRLADQFDQIAEKAKRVDVRG